MTLGELADALARLEELTKQRNRERVPIQYRRGELTEDEYQEIEAKRQQRLADLNAAIEQVRATNIN